MSFSLQVSRYAFDTNGPNMITVATMKHLKMRVSSCRLFSAATLVLPGLLSRNSKLLPWHGASKGVVYLGGLVIALVVIGALNHTTPSGTVSVQGSVINVAPYVSGLATDILVVPNQPVAERDTLFAIDDTTARAEVARLQATLASA